MSPHMPALLGILPVNTAMSVAALFPSQTYMNTMTGSEAGAKIVTSHVLSDSTWRDTPAAVISRRASEHRPQFSLPPEGPASRAVVDPRTDSNNVGACLPDYSFSWFEARQDGDTWRHTLFFARCNFFQ